MNPTAKIFAGTGSQKLAERICKSYGCPMGKINIQKFSDGEIQPIFTESIRGDFVFLVQSTYAPADNIMELLLMIDAARRASAYKIIVVMPYYGYARQDRKDRPRVAIGSKLLANMLVAAGADRIITMDLHAPQIQGYFDIPVDHLDSSAVFIPYITQLRLENLTFAAPDVGATNRIREIASYFEAEMVICDKHRKRANEIASMVVIGLWHEISPRYLAWGLYHAAGILVWQSFQRAKRHLPRAQAQGARLAATAAAVVLTFNFVMLSFAITKETSLRDAAGALATILLVWR